MIEAHDEITGEVLPPQRAADGNLMFPVSNTFGQFMSTLGDGAYDGALYDDLKKMVGELRDMALSNGGKAKGALSLKIGFAVEGSAFFITTEHKISLPSEKHPRSIMWATEDGRFTPNAPNQGVMFGVRDASAGRATFRNA